MDNIKQEIGDTIDMVLFCPACGHQHIDAPDDKGWSNPHHRSHLCHSCGTVWRPADVPTNGVLSIGTAGENDTFLGFQAVRIQPTAWIIERRGCAPTMTHYKTVADSQRSMGAIVTPYCSQF